MATNLIVLSNTDNNDMVLSRLAEKHSIPDIEEWKKLNKSWNFDELRKRLDQANRDILINFVRKKQPNSNVEENEDVFDVAERLDFGCERLFDVRLVQFNDHDFRTKNWMGEVDILVYLICKEKYELLCKLFEQENIGQHYSDYSLQAAAPALHAACLDNANKHRNAFIRSYLEHATKDSLTQLLFFNNNKSCFSNQTEEYVRNYCGVLLWVKELHPSFQKLLPICAKHIHDMIIDEKADNAWFFLNILVGEHVITIAEQKRLLTSPLSFSGWSLFESMMLRASPEVIRQILINMEKEEVTELLTKRKGRWLLTDLAVQERGGAIETILEYGKDLGDGIDLTDDEKKEFHSQLVAGDLSQKMILLLKELASDYIIPEGTGGARKHALMYYIVKGREECGEKCREKCREKGGEKCEEKGAEKEAKDLKEGLEEMYFLVQSRKDWTASTLDKYVKEDIQRVKDNCSVVIMFVMAHGSADRVKGADGEMVTCNHIDEIINRDVPDGIPRISIIDACRKQEGKPGLFKGIMKILFRKNQPKARYDNYVRIMAAAKGEVTRRNEMLPILIEEMKIGRKEGREKRREFFDTICRVRKRMKNHSIPECRRTLMDEQNKSMDRALYL